MLTDEAKKYLKKLNRSDKIRIVSVLERCKLRPHSFVNKLVSSKYFRLRVGDYRLILDIQSGKLIIYVIEIGKRKNIHKQ